MKPAYKWLPTVPILSQIDPLHDSQTHFRKIYLDSVLPFTFRSSKLSFWLVVLYKMILLVYSTTDVTVLWYWYSQNIPQQLGSGRTENNAESFLLVDCSFRSSRDKGKNVLELNSCVCEIYGSQHGGAKFVVLLWGYTAMIVVSYRPSPSIILGLLYPWRREG